MVAELDVRTVAPEADYAEVLKIDAFVQGGEGDAKSILRQQRAGWIWDKAYRFDPVTGRSEKPELLQLGPVPPATVEAALVRPEAFFLPLHSSALEKWWGEPSPMRIIGASFAPAYADKYLHPVQVGAAFDALVYLPHA